MENKKTLQKVVQLDPARLARRKIYAGVPEDDVQLALAICQKYDLDPLLRHVVLIKGRGKDDRGNWIDRYNVYITRDGLLHTAHQSGVPFSIQFGEPTKKENPYTDGEDIYLSGTLHRSGHPPFEAGLWLSEYVQTGKDGKAIGAWRTHPAAMHQKVVEVYLLRRGFDVSLTPLEEIEAVMEGQIVEPADDGQGGRKDVSDNDSPQDPDDGGAAGKVCDYPANPDLDALDWPDFHDAAVNELGFGHKKHAINALTQELGQNWGQRYTKSHLWEVLKAHQAAKEQPVEAEQEQIPL